MCSCNAVGIGAATETRATVLRKIAESDELQTRELNNAFVTMEYFGYLRRDPRYFWSSISGSTS